MRRKKNGERWFMDLSAQEQIAIVEEQGKYPAPTFQDAWLSLTRQFLGDNDYMATRCGVSDALPVVTARAALRNLIEYLERNK